MQSLNFWGQILILCHSSIVNVRHFAGMTHQLHYTFILQGRKGSKYMFTFEHQFAIRKYIVDSE